MNPTCGLKQGDPLSSHFFNFLVDVMLRFVPIEIAVNIDGAKENAISFADDTILLASSRTGLQELINCVIEFFAECGLRENPAKCSTLAIENIPKKKQTVVNVGCEFSIQDRRLPSLKRSDQ